MMLLAVVVVALELAARGRVGRTVVRRTSGVSDLLDLLAFSAHDGSDARDALATAHRWGSEPIATELGRAVERIDRGHAVSEALAAVSTRDPVVRFVLSAVADADAGLESLVSELERVRVDVLQIDSATVAAGARRMAVWQAAPLVLCHLPAVVLIAIAPTLVDAL